MKERYSLMKWFEVRIEVNAEVAEAVSDVLSRFAPGGVAIEARGENHSLTSGTVAVKAYLPVGPSTPHTQQQIEEALWHLGQISPIPAPSFSTVAEEDWADIWKQHFHPLRVGQHIVIKPSWRDVEFAPEDVVIELDPGMAFGTGLHPTTQMCLEVLERKIAPGMQVLDLGTGSGILAIAAAKLGAARILALDTDPVAVEVAHENARRNGVASLVTVTQGSLDRTAEAYDLVVVNILAKVIIELAKSGLAQRVRPGGEWAAAGIIESQVADVAAALEAAGLQISGQRQMADWVALVGCKPKGS
jgi:ribosomal protein L11 methyltransferase